MRPIPGKRYPICDGCYPDAGGMGLAGPGMTYRLMGRGERWRVFNFQEEKNPQ